MILKNQEKNKYIINDLNNYAKKLGLNKKVGIEIFEKKVEYLIVIGWKLIMVRDGQKR